MPSARLLLPPLPRPARAPRRPLAGLVVAARGPASPRPASSFRHQPAPPRLPPDEQAEFERLQRAVAERFAAAPPAAGEAAATAATAAPEDDAGGVWRGAPPEFEGDKNPKTGEVGGPKNEPLRWGAAGDWSYNGRVTDF